MTCVAVWCAYASEPQKQSTSMENSQVLSREQPPGNCWPHEQTSCTSQGNYRRATLNARSNAVHGESSTGTGMASSLHCGRGTCTCTRPSGVATAERRPRALARGVGAALATAAGAAAARGAAAAAAAATTAGAGTTATTAPPTSPPTSESLSLAMPALLVVRVPL